jgi:hypothetical protein
MRIKKGSRVARKYFQAAGISTPSPFALYTVEIDTHYLDIIVIDPETGRALGRPFLLVPLIHIHVQLSGLTSVCFHLVH